MEARIIWSVYPRNCEFTRRRMTEDAAAPGWHYATPEAAWAALMERAAAWGFPVDAAEYVVVAARLTGEQTKHGAARLVVDWATARDPLTRPDPVEAGVGSRRTA